jgi:ATP-dependent Clp protease ATP-binding subunit ClpC
LEDSFFAVEVTKDDVDEVIARWTGVPVMSVKQKEAEKLLSIESALLERIVSQRPAISARWRPGSTSSTAIGCMSRSTSSRGADARTHGSSRIAATSISN